MDLLVFFISFLFLLVITLGLNHYRMIFSQQREQYQRNELIDVKMILEEQWSAVFQSGDSSQTYLNFGISIFIGFLLTFMGGLYNASHQSYLFHSALLPAALFFLIPYLKDHVFTENEPASFVMKMLNDETVLLMGFGLATAAQALTVYGLYHAISFLWVFINVIVIIGGILYKLAKPGENRQPKADKKR